MSQLDLLLEAERRGILPADKKPILDEARRRGLLTTSKPPTVEAVTGEYGSNPYNYKQPVLPYLEDRAKKYLTETVGFPVDAINAALGAAGLGSREPVGGSASLQRFTGFRGLKPPSTEAEAAGTVVGNVAASVPFAGWAARTGRLSPVIMELGAGAGMGVGEETAKMAAPGNEAAQIAGQMIGGILPYRAGGVINELTAGGKGAKSGLNEAAMSEANRRVRADIQKALASEDPVAVFQAVKDYRGLREAFPDLRVGVGEITGNDALLSMQREAAAKSIETLSEAGARSRTNREAIQRGKGMVVPPSSVHVNQAISNQRRALAGSKGSIESSLNALSRQSEARMDAIERAATGQFEAGSALAERRADLFARSRNAAREKYDAFRNALGEQAEDLVDASGINSMISALRREDPAAHRMPALFHTVEDITARRTEVPPIILGPTGLPIAMPANQQLRMDDLLSIEKAIGKDIRLARIQQPPDRELIRRLDLLSENVSAAIRGNAKQETVGLYDEARRYYREEHVPRFLSGINYKIALPDAYGDLRVKPENVVSQYFKPGDTTNATRFRELFGDDAGAQASLYGGVLDKYRFEVIENGGGQKLHDAFMRKYEAPLRVYGPLRNTLATHGGAVRAIAEQQALLREEARSIAESRIAKVLNTDLPEAAIERAMQSPQNMGALMFRMPKAERQSVVTAVMERGWELFNREGADAFELWFQRNQNTIKTAMAGAYGRKAAEEHVKNVGLVMSSAKLVERDPTFRISTQAVRQAEDPVKEKLGSSIPSLVAQWWAMVSGRVGPHYAGGVFAARLMANMTRQQYLQLVRQTLYEPETLKDVAHAMTTGNKVSLSKARSKALDILQIGLGRDVPGHLAKRLPVYGAGTEDEQ